jgi:hypothetical protein
LSPAIAEFKGLFEAEDRFTAKNQGLYHLEEVQSDNRRQWVTLIEPEIYQ